MTATAPVDLILDCDPGIDDALALFLAAAARERLRLLGVTTVAGNRPGDTTFANARALLHAAGCGEVPVSAGARGPIDGGPARCNLVHGEDGLGGVALPPPPASAEASHPNAAPDFIVRTLRDRPPGSVTLVAVGPLSNLALAERQSPGVLRRCRELLIMGGAVTCPGNVTPRAEFNFYADALAAQEVLASGARSTLFGLDVTSQTALPPAWIESLGDLGNRCGRWARDMLQAYAKVDPLLHDPCPLVWLLRPALFKSRTMRLAVNCEAGDGEGEVRASATDAAAPVEVVLEIDKAGFLVLLHEQLARLP